MIFCSCTSTRLIPSVATWLSGQLGIFQTHVSCDLVAACAGFPYGIGEAVRLLQDDQAPGPRRLRGEVLRQDRQRPAIAHDLRGRGGRDGHRSGFGGTTPGDVEIFQTYASGPASQVNSIIWPNPEFDNNVTVWGPEVKALVERYLVQMMGELRDLPHPDDPGRALVDAIDLVVPHQANRTMVIDLAGQAGIPEESLYFNIDRVGNVSAASIPIAIHDAVTDGVIDRRMRIFAPGFGAGAVAGYVVLWIDPEIIVPESPVAFASEGDGARATTVDDVREAFG